MADAPKTLPANFFDQQSAEAPKTLPPDFFNSEGTPVYSTTVTAKGPAEQAGDFGSHLASGLNPINWVKGLYHVSQQIMTDPKGAAKTLGLDSSDTQAKIKSAVDSGDYLTAARHLLGFIPVVGPQIDAMGDEAQKGNYGAALGDAAAFGLTQAVPMSPVANAAMARLPNVRAVPSLMSRNPTEAAALEYMDQAGVPMSAGVRTGNAFVRGAEKVADHSPIGSVVASRAETAATDALKAEAGRLVNRARPETPSAQNYATFEKAAEDPKNWRDVPTGRTLNTPGRESKVLDANGQPMASTPPGSIDVTERMPMPVKVGELIPQLQKVVDDFEMASGVARNETAAFSVAKKLLSGPDYVPAMTAEKALSALKDMAREANGVAAGTAKMLVPKLQKMIDESVASTAGPKVMEALQVARKSAAAEKGVDALEKMFTKAEAEGGFKRADGIWADWQRLPAREKLTMFQHDPQLVGDTSKFLLGFKKMAENPNPSGSGYITAISGQMAWAITHPATGVPYLLAAGAISKLLHSPAGARALAQGVKVSLAPGAPAAAKAAAAASILRLAGDSAKPMADTPLPKAAQSSDPSQQTAPLATMLPPQ